jgi:uncharacterized membrane protein HdeD (DUF308 family)
MSDLTAQDKRDISTMLGRTWGAVLTAGILTLGLGVIVLVWPQETVVVVSWLLGVYLIISGVIQLVQSFTGNRSGGVRAMFAIGGVLSLVLGLFAFRSVAHSVTLLVVIIGVAWLISGITTLMTAISEHDLPGRGWAIFSGILGILGGFIILAWPAPTLYVLFTFFGIWLVVVGCFEIFASFKMRSEGQRLALA